ncbi:aromatic ring-hydroxylating oxygenase subunit alpha [Aquabacterium sp. J223]|uniref:aromatic ring-hydroxylating oxygenase subunit alpha n=1 Tax=Aquabacterium sp. J223 TaxID=2898431 RepID=UPI0021AD9290|nr:SRPBCC family protein [Aquabacterium sp. J223]UUX95342.1 Rieske 2Fe-2S domain-containing protein [Aquabacterium sp. J223]
MQTDTTALVDDAAADGRFHVHARIYSDPALYEQELRHVFERTWSFLGVASQLVKPHDYLTTHIGRTPVLVTRGGDGTIRAFVNACRHKGALLSRLEQGNRRNHVCPYHGWSYDSSGRNVLIKDQADGAYGAPFASQSHDLVPLGAFDEYRGLLFGSLSADVPPLPEFLGEARPLLDLALQQGEHGMELVPGRCVYTYRGNWKLQMDNGLDFYHLTSTHAAFMGVVQRRESERKGNTDARQFDWRARLVQEGGAFGFDHGHAAIWLEQPQPEKRPLWPVVDEVRSRVGEVRARWMLKLRNLNIFPNLQIADSTSLILRTFRPLGPDLTEMRVHCLAPIGEPDEQRAWRLRQFEDFFNPSGLATSDDTVIYEDCQAGSVDALGWLQGFQRGLGADLVSPTPDADELGMRPRYSVKGTFRMQNEVCFHAAYREWARLMAAGAEGRPAYPGLDGGRP